MKLSDMYPVDRDLVARLIKEEIDINWLRDLIKGKKGIYGVGGHGDLSRAEHFMHLLWDNLTEKQRNKVVEALNLIIEEDLFLEDEPAMNYWSHLLEFMILLNAKLPSKINTKPFIIWKEKKYPNLMNSSEKVHPEFIKKLNQKIDNAFGKKEKKE